MRIRLLAVGVMIFWCAAAAAFPSYGTYVDNTCTARG